MATAVLFSDDFNRPDEGLEVSPNWDNVSLDYDIIGNEVKIITANGSMFPAWVNSLAARQDMVVQAKIKTSLQFMQAHLVARRTSDGTYYYGGVATGAGGLQIGRVVDGVRTPIATAQVPQPTTYRTFRFEVVGTSLKLYDDGVLALSTTDGNIVAAGFGGIMAFNGGGPGDASFYDDFSISAPVIDVDKVIPVQYRTRIELDNVVPVHYLFANLLRINPEIPVSYRLQGVFDNVIPILWQPLVPLKLDHSVPVNWRRLLEVDLEIPIRWSGVDIWIKEATSQADTFAPQAGSESDAWIKDPASQAESWTPQAGSG